MFGGPNENFTWGTQQQDPNNFARAPRNMSRDQALAMVGQAPGTSFTGNIDRDLDAYYGQDVSGRGGDYSVYGDTSFGQGSSSGSGAHAIGGVSAVNPQAGQANELDAFRRYEDAAYSDAMRHLQPQFDASQRQFDQQMASRGIPVGSDAYNTAKAEFEQNKSGALESAAFGAMQFGLGAQNQSFQQDHARSALANALLQAQWQKELGWGNISLGQQNLGLQQNRLNESARQFNDNLGFQYDTFYDTLANNQHQFDSNMDYNFWDRGNYWDLAFDRANSSDYFNAWDRDNASQQYDNSLLLSLLGMGPPGVQGANPYAAYGSQVGAANQAYGNMLGSPFMSWIFGG